MKILVTGGAGFIGSHIVDAYIEQGHDVTVVDDLSSGKKKNLNPRARFVAADVRDPNLSTLFGESRFEVVNHLAAQMDVRKSVQDPFFDASVNILGGLRMLECSRSYGVRKFIFSSSGGTIYGECPTPAKKTMRRSPNLLTASAKTTSEKYIRFYGRRLSIALHDSALRQCLWDRAKDPARRSRRRRHFRRENFASQAETVTIYGDGRTGTRLCLMSPMWSKPMSRKTLTKGAGKNSVFNIGTGIATSVNTLYEKMARDLEKRQSRRLCAGAHRRTGAQRFKYRSRLGQTSWAGNLVDARQRT